VLHYRKDTQRDAEYWVLLTEAAPDLNALRDARGPSTCPADSIFQFAASCKVDEDLLEPASNSASNAASDSQQGRLWQWSLDEQQWRLRSVQGARGVLSVVERTP
jgi:hypothetical protein